MGGSESDEAIWDGVAEVSHELVGGGTLFGGGLVLLIENEERLFESADDIP